MGIHVGAVGKLSNQPQRGQQDMHLVYIEAALQYVAPLNMLVNYSNPLQMLARKLWQCCTSARGPLAESTVS